MIWPSGEEGETRKKNMSRPILLQAKYRKKNRLPAVYQIPRGRLVDFDLRLDHRGKNFSLNLSVHICLVVKCGCHCAYTNENSDDSNQKVTSECGVSVKQKSPTIVLLSRFTKIISTL